MMVPANRTSGNVLGAIQCRRMPLRPSASWSKGTGYLWKVQNKNERGKNEKTHGYFSLRHISNDGVCRGQQLQNSVRRRVDYGSQSWKRYEAVSGRRPHSYHKGKR